MFPKEQSKVGALEMEELLITGDTEEEIDSLGQESAKFIGEGQRGNIVSDATTCLFYSGMEKPQTI